MYYSSVWILVIVTVLSLSGANSKRYPRDSWGHKMHDMPDYEDPYQEVFNFGNGVNRKNFVKLDDRSNYPGSSISNIGNGMNNRNIVMMGKGDGGRTEGRENSDNDGWANGGTSVFRNKDNGLDVFNIGYGRDNQNKVTYNGRPIQPDCRGSTCPVLKSPKEVSNTARTNQDSSIFLVFSLLNFFFLNNV